MPRVEINGLNVHYQSLGAGPDLVLIHGISSNLAFWYFSVLPYLTRRYRVTLYDLRGHGFSGVPPTAYTSADMAADLRALLQHLGIGRAHLVGHSFGGAVALHCAVLDPRSAISLTLVDAWVPSLQPSLPPREAGYWQELRARLRQRGIDVPEETPRVAYALLEEMALMTPEAPPTIDARAVALDEAGSSEPEEEDAGDEPRDATRSDDDASDDAAVCDAEGARTTGWARGFGGSAGRRGPVYGMLRQRAGAPSGGNGTDTRPGVPRAPRARQGRGFGPAGFLINHWDRDSRVARAWARMMHTTTADRDLHEIAGLTLERFRQVRQPTLAIFGARSRCLPTLRSLRDNLPHCRAVIVPRTGHFHPIVRPRTLVKHLNEFIDGLPRSGA